jgi:hypothetical protein
MQRTKTICEITAKNLQSTAFVKFATGNLKLVEARFRCQRSLLSMGNHLAMETVLMIHSRICSIFFKIF